MKELVKEDVDFLRPLLQELIQEALEAEMDETVCAKIRRANRESFGISKWLL
jgi:transposase-like protein